MEPLTYEEARVRLAVQEELAYAHELLSEITPAAGETMGAAVMRRIITRTDIRARVEDTPVEVELIRRAKEGDDTAYFRVMFGYAESLRGFAARARSEMGTDDDDVVEAATSAIAAAIHRYDPARGTKLTATLNTYGKTELNDVLNPTKRVHGRTADTRTVSRYYSIIDAAKVAAAAELSRTTEGVTRDDWIAHARRIAAERYAADPKHALSLRAFDFLHSAMGGEDVRLDDAPENPANYSGDDPELNHELFAAPVRFVPDSEENVHNRMLAAQAMSVLDERELEVVRYAYGFPPESYQEMSNGEVAEELKTTRGYSVSTVRRIRNRALEKMRLELGVEEGEE